MVPVVAHEALELGVNLLVVDRWGANRANGSSPRDPCPGCRRAMHLVLIDLADVVTTAASCRVRAASRPVPECPTRTPEMLHTYGTCRCPESTNSTSSSRRIAMTHRRRAQVVDRHGQCGNGQDGGGWTSSRPLVQPRSSASSRVMLAPNLAFVEVGLGGSRSPPPSRDLADGHHRHGVAGAKKSSKCVADVAGIVVAHRHHTWPHASSLRTRALLELVAIALHREVTRQSPEIRCQLIASPMAARSSSGTEQSLPDVKVRHWTIFTGANRLRRAMGRPYLRQYLAKRLATRPCRRVDLRENRGGVAQRPASSWRRAPDRKKRRRASPPELRN